MQIATSVINNYLVRMDSQASEAKSAYSKLKAETADKSDLKSRLQIGAKAFASDMKFRAERIGVFFLTSLASVTHFVLLPLAFIAYPIKFILAANPASKLATAYFKFLERHLCLILELLPSIASPCFRPTWFATNALALGKIYRTGVDGDKSTDKAFEIYSSIAYRSAEGMYQKTKMQEQGLAGTRDPYAIYENYHKISKHHAKAAFKLGKNYLDGNTPFGVNKEKGHNLLMRASSQGFAKASLTMGLAFERKSFNIANHNQRAKEWYQKAIDQGNTKAEISLAQLLIKMNEEGSYKKGMGILESVAERNHDFSDYANSRLAVMYINNAKIEVDLEANAAKDVKLKDTPPAGPKKSLELYQKAIKHYQNIIDSIEDKKSSKAYKLDFKKEANWFLGEMYRKGSCGQTKDFAKALSYLEAAAVSAPEMRYEIAQYYETGELGPKDLTKAKEQLLKLPEEFKGKKAALNAIELAIKNAK